MTKHFYANGVQVAKMVGSTVYYEQQDLLRNTRLVMTGGLVTQFSSNYKPYGQGYQKTGSEVFAYTGKPNDTATGFYYYGARYYDPSIGRFVSEDTGEYQ